MLPAATKMLSNRLKIRGPGVIPALGDYLDYCTDGGDLTPASQYRNSSTDADFLLIIGGFTQSSNTIAYAYYCLQGKAGQGGPRSIFSIKIKIFLGKVEMLSEESGGRPVVGVARFNTQHLSYQKGRFRSDVATFAHEVMHAIFFHPNLFSTYFPRNSSGQSFLFNDADNFYKIRGTHVLKEIRDHFNCPSATGGESRLPRNPQRRWKTEGARALRAGTSRS